MSRTPYLSGWRYRAVMISVAFSAACYLGFSLWGGWRAVSDAMTKVGMLGISITLLMSSINYGIRFLRWQGYLSALGHTMPWKPSLRIYLAGFALTTTPGKAGEAVRGLLLKSWGIPYPKSFAALLSERLSDVFGVVLLTLFGLTLYPDARPMIAASGALIATGFMVLSQHSLAERLTRKVPKHWGKLARLLRHLSHLLSETQRCHQFRMLISATACSVLAWGAEALAFYWILNWMGADIPLAFAVFIYTLSMLAGAISFMPGGLGGAEAVMVALLIWKGMPEADAIAATVLIRLATLWYAVGIGAYFLTKTHVEKHPANTPL